MRRSPSGKAAVCKTAIELVRFQHGAPISMIHKVKNCYVISSHQVWMPGAYDTEKTARYAFQFSDEILSKLQEEANLRNGGLDGVITMVDLKTRRSNLKKTK